MYFSPFQHMHSSGIAAIYHVINRTAVIPPIPPSSRSRFFFFCQELFFSLLRETSVADKGALTSSVFDTWILLCGGSLFLSASFVISSASCAGVSSSLLFAFPSSLFARRISRHCSNGLG